MKKDLTELKKVVVNILEKDDSKNDYEQTKAFLINDLNDEIEHVENKIQEVEISPDTPKNDEHFHPSEIIEESLSLAVKEKEMIEKALEWNSPLFVLDGACLLLGCITCHQRTCLRHLRQIEH